MEVYTVPGGTHAADMLIAYMPKGGKALYVADMSNVPDFIPLRTDALSLPAIGLIGAKEFLLDKIQRLKLDVQQFVPMHDQRAVPFGEWQKAVDIEHENLRRFEEANK